MTWTVTMHINAYADYDGTMHAADTKTFECPFECFQDVYYAYPEERMFRKTRWVVRKSSISSVWATNMFGVCLDTHEHIPEDMFHRLFTDKEAAIEFCLKKNNQAKVKVYY